MNKKRIKESLEIIYGLHGVDPITEWGKDWFENTLDEFDENSDYCSASDLNDNVLGYVDRHGNRYKNTYSDPLAEYEGD